MEPSCSIGSLQVGEPLAGTASAETDLWIVLEHAGTWGPKGADDSGLPAEVVQHFVRFTAQEKRARVQLIRRPERSRSGVSVYLARSTPGRTSLIGAVLARIEDFLAVDLAAWAGGELPQGFQPIAEPLYLVCVHGRRDRCCALHGMPVFSALDAIVPNAVFQTTHLGGHRFAATLLVLPDGICYGRMQADEAEALVAAHKAGNFHALTRARGRCAYPAAAQAAELRLCEELHERSLAALELLIVEPQPSGDIEVRFRQRATGLERSVTVVKQALAPSAQSCGATPKPSEALVALSSR